MAAAVIGIDPIWLGLIPDNNICGTIAINITYGHTRGSVGAITQAAQPIILATIADDKPSLEAAAAIVEIDCVLLSAIADNNVQVAIIVDISQCQASRRIGGCTKAGYTAGKATDK
jgi:hypothetical protein